MVVVCSGLRWFTCFSPFSPLIVPNSGGGLWWFAVVCGGLRWFVVVCGDLRWFVVICGGLSYSHTRFALLLSWTVWRTATCKLNLYDAVNKC